MEHLNYCRQAIKQWREYCSVPSAKDRDLLLQLGILVDLSKKFLLPEGGRLIEDFSLRGLNDEDPLRLPYDLIACEYSFGSSMAFKPYGDDRSYDRYIVLAHDAGEQITFWSVARNCANGLWMPSEFTSISKTNYLLREGKEANLVFQRDQVVDGRAAYDAKTLMHLLNALQCSNVSIERSEPRNAGKKIKAALPFDTYHVLTIDVGRSPSMGAGLAGCSHRSPREHLRRGHIRRLGDGRRIWVNATVVSAGRGFAKVEKDYRVVA
jgi:hypothetical protein